MRWSFRDDAKEIDGFPVRRLTPDEENIFGELVIEIPLKLYWLHKGSYLDFIQVKRLLGRV